MRLDSSKQKLIEWPRYMNCKFRSPRPMLTAHKVMGGSGKDESNIWKYGDRNNAQLQASINASELMQKMKEAERKPTAAELENERTRKKCED